MDSEEVIGLIVFGTLVIEGRERDGRHYSAIMFAIWVLVIWGSSYFNKNVV
jgi:hypothetical protein